MRLSLEDSARADEVILECRRRNTTLDGTVLALQQAGLTLGRSAAAERARRLDKPGRIGRHSRAPNVPADPASTPTRVPDPGPSSGLRYHPELGRLLPTCDVDSVLDAIDSAATALRLLEALVLWFEPRGHMMDRAAAAIVEQDAASLAGRERT